MKELYKNNNIKYYNKFTHRVIDLATILKYLYYAGKLKEDIYYSDQAFNYFNIIFSIGTRYITLGGARAIALIFNELLEFIK